MLGLKGLNSACNEMKFRVCFFYAKPLILHKGHKRSCEANSIFAAQPHSKIAGFLSPAP